MPENSTTVRDVATLTVARAGQVEETGGPLVTRQAIAARETRIATRLRAIEHAYTAVAGHDTALKPPEPDRAFRPPGHAADKEIELE